MLAGSVVVHPHEVLAGRTGHVQPEVWEGQLKDCYLDWIDVLVSATG